MNRKDFGVIIIGGGITGLIVAESYSRFFNVLLIEKGEIGKESLYSNGLFYIHYTKKVESYFNYLNIPYNLKKINGAITLGKEIVSYPECLLSMGICDGMNVWMSYYRNKMEKMPYYGNLASDDLWQGLSIEAKERDGFATGLKDFIKNRARVTIMENSKVEGINLEDKYVKVGLNKIYYKDRVIVTIPFHNFQKLIGKPLVGFNSGNDVPFMSVVYKVIWPFDTDRIWWDYLLVGENNILQLDSVKRISFDKKEGWVYVEGRGAGFFDYISALKKLWRYYYKEEEELPAIKNKWAEIIINYSPNKELIKKYIPDLNNSRVYLVGRNAKGDKSMVHSIIEEYDFICKR